MDNLEKLLDDIKIADAEPDEMLVRRTKTACNKNLREERKADIVNKSRKSRLTVQLLAAAAFVAFLMVALVVASVSNRTPMEGAAYYTIDINPSLGFTVDENSNVIGVTLQNEDAKNLYEGMDLIGLKIEQALSLVIKAAQQKGYLNTYSERFILLGQFMEGMSEEKGTEILNQLMLDLQNEVGDEVHIIGLKGDQEDLKEAEELEVSPGILVLCELVGDVEAGEDVKVEDVVDKLPEEYKNHPEFAAPVISVSAEGNMLIISWDEIDFSKVTIEGAEVEYKLLKGTTLDEIKEKMNVADSLTVSLNDDQPSKFVIDIETEDMNEQMYYCLYVNCSNTSKLSNVMPVEMQTVISTEPTQEPRPTPQPINDTETGIEVDIEGNYITIYWTQAEANDRFNGYKVMYSATDSTPVYGEEGCYYLEYVTDISTTKGTYKLSSLNGYAEGKKYYFSITALYDEQETKVAGKVVSKTMPTTTVENTPKPTETPTTEYPSTSIWGEGNGQVFELGWNKITHPDLEGYKVVYSFTDSTPVYGENSYVRWITNPSTTSARIEADELGEHGEGHVYFSITALYNDHSVKKPGNSVKLTTYGYTSAPYVTPTLTSAANLEEGIKLKWNGIEHPELKYYKANYSFTNSSPAYGASGTTSHMTYDLSKWADVTGLVGYGPGETCYVSVTAVYNNGKKTSSVMTVTIPEETTPTYTAANLTGASYLGDGQFSLSWSTVESSDFSEYTLLYSVNGSGYSACAEILSMTTSSKTVTLSVSQGDTVKFKIATYYNADYSNPYYGSTIKTVEVPVETVEPTPTPSITTSGADGDTLYLNWTCESHTYFETYKIYYEINDGGEIYGGSTEGTNWTKTLTEYADGDNVSMWVVGVYSNGDNNWSTSASVTMVTY